MSQFFFEDAHSRVFASPSSWIEGSAIRQVEQTCRRNGVVRVAGMPDLHPGHKGPVGCAVLSEGVVHPGLIGTDIGCGMTLFVLDVDKGRLRLDRIEKSLRAMPDIDAGEHDLPDGIDARHARLLGSVGGGNHFAELQGVASSGDGAPDGIRSGKAVLLVHSGSRALGTEIFAPYAENEDGLQEEEAEAYLRLHDQAMSYARLNRRRIGERFLEAAGLSGEVLLDVPHNFVERTEDGFLHRKGASPSDRGPAPVAGSRGTASHLVVPTGSDAGNLASLAHGAGRKRDRRATSERRRAKSADEIRKLERSDGRVICADNRLRNEEAPDAYKDVRQVISDLEAFGLARSVAVMEPLLTFKRSGVAHDDE